MIEKANIDDPEAIAALVNRFAEQQLMLPRPLHEIYDQLRDFYVYREDGDVLGCVALHISWKGLAEIRSLAVAEEARGQGVATRLIEACLDEARELGVPRVFTLTNIPDFFQRFGFSHYPKEELPHKIWSECIKCPKFPNCDEEALILDLQSDSSD